MVNVPRIHCHSAYKHYQMFHWDSGSSYGNSVFNTTYNFNGGTMCGGGFWGGLWGGLGMGLGAGLMNLLGGGLFGGGMNMFGGSPIMNWWGRGGFQREGAGERNTNINTSTSTSTSTKVVEKECNNKDDKIINDLRVELNTLKAKEELSQKEIDTLREKVLKAKDDSDEHHKTEDDRAYVLLLEDIKLLKVKKTDGDDDSDDDDNGDDNNPIINNNGTITLNFGVRDDKNNVIDDNIKGHLVGIKTETNNNEAKISTYVIDSSNFPGQKFGLRYKITKNQNGTYNVKCINKTHHNCSKYGKLYINPKGVNYTVENDGKLHNTGTDFVVSAQYHAGYTPIEYKTDKLKDNDYVMPELDDNYEEVQENNEDNIKIRIKSEEA